MLRARPIAEPSRPLNKSLSAYISLIFAFNTGKLVRIGLLTLCEDFGRDLRKLDGNEI